LQFLKSPLEPEERQLAAIEGWIWGWFENVWHWETSADYEDTLHAVTRSSLLAVLMSFPKGKLPLKLPLFELNKTKKDPYKHHSGKIRISHRINGFRHLQTACIRLKIRRGSTLEIGFPWDISQLQKLQTLAETDSQGN
jgi:hypothetical protein